MMMAAEMGLMVMLVEMEMRVREHPVLPDRYSDAERVLMMMDAVVVIMVMVLVGEVVMPVTVPGLGR